MFLFHVQKTTLFTKKEIIILVVLEKDKKNLRVAYDGCYLSRRCLLWKILFENLFTHLNFQQQWSFIISLIIILTLSHLTEFFQVSSLRNSSSVPSQPIQQLYDEMYMDPSSPAVTLNNSRRYSYPNSPVSFWTRARSHGLLQLLSEDWGNPMT